MRFQRIALPFTALALVFRFGRAGNCLKRLKDFPIEFEECKRINCFMFLNEPPYITLDKRMKNHNDSKLFPCTRPLMSGFSQLQGNAFDVMSSSYEFTNALCVWGGPDCQFNDMVNYIDQASSDYKLGATGLLLENKQRLRENVKPSISLLSEVMVIFGEQQESRMGFPVYKLLHPFRRDTWLAFTSFLTAFVMLSMLAARVLGPRSNTVSDVIQNTFQFYVCPTFTSVTIESSPIIADGASMMRRQRLGERLATCRAVRHLMRVSLSVTFVIFLMFYEVAVVNFLFIQQSAPRLKNVKDLTKEELAQFCVERDAATEDVWNKTVFSPGKYNIDERPWKRCKDDTECFSWALNDKNPVKYVVGFKSSGVYQITSRNACEKMAIYEIEDEGKILYSFGAGWLYGSLMKTNFTQALDRDILKMHETDRLPRIIEDNAGIPNFSECRSKITDIDVGVIGASVVLLVVPPFLLISALLFWYSVKIRKLVAEAERRRLRLERKRRYRERQYRRALELECIGFVKKPPTVYFSKEWGNSVCNYSRNCR